MIPYTGKHKPNSGIYDYMNSAKLIQKAPDDAIVKPDQTEQYSDMTVAECESLILKIVKAYKARPHKITERQALAMLHSRNEAAKREGLPIYNTVKAFLTSRPLPPAAR
jgi:hypothetical protein